MQKFETFAKMLLFTNFQDTEQCSRKIFKFTEFPWNSNVTWTRNRKQIKILRFFMKIYPIDSGKNYT